MMQILKYEEMKRLQKEYPKEIEEFYPGDKVAVHKLISLDNDKEEIIRGTVLERRSTDMVNDSFIIINYQVNTLYEMQIPIWSPFIKAIKVLAPGPRKLSHYRH